MVNNHSPHPGLPARAHCSSALESIGHSIRLNLRRSLLALSLAAFGFVEPRIMHSPAF